MHRQVSPTPPAQQGKIALTRRYRRWYSTLPANLQLVGLQLWLPLFFVVMFCVCYVGAFHAPSFRGLDVGVVANDQTATIEQQLGDKVDLTIYQTVDQAKQAVRDGEVAGVYHPGQTQDRLYVASAVQMQAGMIASQVFVPLADRANHDLTTVDVAPLPAHDAFGMTAMYLMLAICIGGYMVGMFLGMMGAPLRHRTRFLTLLGSSIVLSFVIAALSSPLIGAISGHFWSIWGISFAWMLTIGIVVNGIGYFTGRFVASVAMIIFVFLSVPASGAALPISLMPDVFQSINGLVVGSGITGMLKHAIYGVGSGFATGFVQMAIYFVVGIVLSIVGKRYWERRHAHKIINHETTMFSDAQRASAEHHRQMRAEIFRDAGLELPEEIAKQLATIDNGVSESLSPVDVSPRGIEDEDTRS
ncbi:MAG: ABC transporter permease [Candidatus Saccharimonadales bacterium]